MGVPRNVACICGVGEGACPIERYLYTASGALQVPNVLKGLKGQPEHGLILVWRGHAVHAPVHVKGYICDVVRHLFRARAARCCCRRL